MDNESGEIIAFPPVEFALDEPDGLLATGGNLLPATLISAYSKGIFPWYSDDQPIMWWSPNPRAVIFPSEFRPSKSLRRTLRRCGWRVTLNRDFDGVIHACATQPRNSMSEVSDTWITAEMIAAYCELHLQGHAHSIEVWDQHDVLIGGLYGVSCGSVFSGESMFHRETNASKVAFAALCHHAKQTGLQLIDCQLANSHLTSLGAISIPREEFIQLLSEPPKLTSQKAIWDELKLKHACDYAKAFA